MPSLALTKWQTIRKPRLDEFDRQYATVAVSGPGTPLKEENLRAYVMLLSAHFQGFCRDLHSDCVQVLIGKFPELSLLMQMLSNGRLLDRANAGTESIRADFRRLGIELDVALAPDPLSELKHEERMQHIYHLNEWRNYCAHHNNAQPNVGGPFTVSNVRTWVGACDGFAEALDLAMRDHLAIVTGGAPWA